jgi:uncharacterized lipoprotein YmbA
MNPTRPGVTRSRMWRPRVRRSLALTIVLVAAGCGLLRGPTETPTTFYVLSATAEPGQAPAGGDLVLGLGPITFPPYLDRPQMVRRVAPNELVFDEFNRWSEPIKQNFERVLGNDLDRLIGIDRLIAYPWYSHTPMDYAVSVVVMRFEEQPSGDVALDARWTISNAAGKPYLNRETHLTRPARSPAEVAGAMSGMTGDLARDIAGALHELGGKHTP